MGHNLVVTVWQALSTNDGQGIVKVVVTVITSYKGGGVLATMWWLHTTWLLRKGVGSHRHNLVVSYGYKQVLPYSGTLRTGSNLFMLPTECVEIIIL